MLQMIGLALSSLTHALGAAGNVGLMWFTALFSSVTDNIPLAAMLAKIFGPTPAEAAAVPAVQWWAVVFGANLGGNMTPIGSASTVVACTIMKKHGLKIGFVERQIGRRVRTGAARNRQRVSASAPVAPVAS
ncbi:MAG: hypothetical protein IH986_06145 [Planctomycetes bacterium]|nr:hypothetical protein [Planctomycetota bacterium]